MPDMHPAPLFRPLRPLVLASHSPRRQDFLRAVGIACHIASPPEGAEPFPLPGEEPEAFAARAAGAKADAVFALPEYAHCAVLAADTVVFRNGHILGKPRDAEQALEFLRLLAGGAHRVHTACHLRFGPDTRVVFHGEAEVRMGEWPESVLAAYAAGGEGLDKAGAYAVQGQGAFLVTGLTGSWSAVIGLPVAETVAALVAHGVIG